MAIDLDLLASKLKRYRIQLQLELAEVSAATGLDAVELASYEEGKGLPSGDALLILADFYKVDYKFFLSGERLAPFEQTEKLYRSHGDEFSPADRWAVQEFLFLAECEDFLESELSVEKKVFRFEKRGNYFKGHGEQAATAFREFLGYSLAEAPSDVYGDLRRVGLHVFRRRLDNSNISGLFVRHPAAGKCVLINYSEDVYRQRFTAAHEAGHAIFDEEDDVVVSFWDKSDLKEIRANKFASRYLLPIDLLRRIPALDSWTKERAVDIANRLKVSTEALANALSDYGLINSASEATIKSARIKRGEKVDPELSPDISPRGLERRRMLLEKGLSMYYVELCFDAYRKGLISIARMQEMLLVESDVELRELAAICGEVLLHGS